VLVPELDVEREGDGGGGRGGGDVVDVGHAFTL